MISVRWVMYKKRGRGECGRSERKYRGTIATDEKEDDVLVLATRSERVGVVDDVALTHEELPIHVPWVRYLFEFFNSPYLNNHIKFVKVGGGRWEREKGKGWKGRGGREKKR